MPRGRILTPILLQQSIRENPLRYLILHDGDSLQRPLAGSQLRLQHALVGIIQEVLEIVHLLGELLGEDARDSRHVGVVVGLQGLDLPETALQGVGARGVGLGRVEGVVHAFGLERGLGRFVAHRAVQHQGAGGVALQEVVHEGDHGDDGGGGSVEGEAGEALDEAGDEGGGEMGGGEEGVHEAEEAGAVFGVEEVGVEEGVQLLVELRVVEVLLLDEVEEAGEGEEGGRAADVVGVCQEVHEEFGAVEPGLDGVDHDAEQGFALRGGDVAAEDGEPGGLGSVLVCVDGEELLVLLAGLGVEVFELVV